MNISKPRLIMFIIFVPLIVAGIILPILLFDLDTGNGVMTITVGPLISLMNFVNYWIVRKTSSSQEIRNLQASAIIGSFLGLGFLIMGISKLYDIRWLTPVPIVIMLLGAMIGATVYFLNLPQSENALTPAKVAVSAGYGIGVVILGIAAMFLVGYVLLTILMNIFMNLAF